MRKRLVVTLALLVTVSACGPRIRTTMIAPAYPPHPPGTEIFVSTLTALECPFVELGLITARDADFAWDTDFLEALKERARKLGGDALIGLRELDPIDDDDSGGLSATLVRFAESDCRG